MSYNSIIQNIIAAYTPEDKSKKEWLNWLQAECSNLTDIEKECARVGKINPGIINTAINEELKLFSNPFLLPVFSLLNRQFCENNQSNGSRLFEYILKLKLGFSIKLKAENIFKLETRAAEVLSIASCFEVFLESIYKNSNTAISKDELDDDFKKLLVYLCLNFQVNYFFKFNTHPKSEPQLADELMNSAFLGSYIAQKFASTNPLSESDWSNYVNGTIKRRQDSLLRELLLIILEKTNIGPDEIELFENKLTEVIDAHLNILTNTD